MRALPLFAALLAAAARAEDTITIDSQRQLDDIAAKTPIVLLQLSISWCRKCKEFAPTWEKIAATAKSRFGDKIAVATVDCNNVKELNEKYAVYSYPSFVVLRDNGTGWEQWNAKREEAKMMELVELAGSYKSPVAVASAADLAALAKKTSGALLLANFREPVKASTGFTIFRTAMWELARSGHAFTSAYMTSDAERPRKADGKAPPTPGLALLDREGKVARKVLPLPRKKEDFTQHSVVEWLNGAGIACGIEEAPDEFPDKDYYDPDAPPPKSAALDQEFDEEYNEFNVGADEDEYGRPRGTNYRYGVDPPGGDNGMSNYRYGMD